jgi:hypothetical protein
LASGAEAGAAVLHGEPLDGAAAKQAGLASLMSNLKIEMGCAQFALRAIRRTMKFELAFSV